MSEAEVATIRSMLGDVVPADVIRRAIEITGSANAASEWLLENDWNELTNMPPALASTGDATLDAAIAAGAAGAAGAAAAAAAEGLGALEDDDDDDDDDEEDDDEEQEEAEADEPAPKRQKKLVTQTDAPEGVETFWCAFDDLAVHKGHLQLMNIRPKSLSHAKVTLSTIRSKSLESVESAQLKLGDVWANCLPAEDPGYWLVPIGPSELDDTWWKILEPHLLRSCFGEVVVLQTLSSTRRQQPAAAAVPADTLFDEIEERARQEERHTQSLYRYSQARRGATEDKTHVAVALFLASGKPSELRRIGEFLCALFPQHSPLYFRKLVGTAAVEDGASPEAFAHDPRVDKSVLRPDWHSKHAHFRVTRLAEKIDDSNTSSLFPSYSQLGGQQPHRKWRYELTKRSDEKTAEWLPLQE